MQRPNFPKRIVILSDCKAALYVVQGAKAVCPLLAKRIPKRIRELQCEIQSGGHLLALSWVPAHGQVAPDWTPPPGISEAEARQLNDRADRAARKCVLDASLAQPVLRG